jgi:hypothetical protein
MTRFIIIVFVCFVGGCGSQPPPANPPPPPHSTGPPSGGEHFQLRTLDVSHAV